MLLEFKGRFRSHFESGFYKIEKNSTASWEPIEASWPSLSPSPEAQIHVSLPIGSRSLLTSSCWVSGNYLGILPLIAAKSMGHLAAIEGYYHLLTLLPLM